MATEAGPLRAVGVLERVLLWIAMAALAVMMLTTVADVVLRYVFGRPISGAYDVVEVCLAIFVFNGLGAVFSRKQNIVIDVVDHVVSVSAARVLAQIGEILAVGILLVTLWAMVSPAIQAYDYGDQKPELGLPIYVVWMFVFLGASGALICAIGAIVRDRRSNRGPEP